MAVLVLIAGALLGVIFSVIAGQEPGALLGFFIIMGSIAAALGIQRGKAYLLFPAPALAFFVAAILAGKVHDAKLGSSTAGLGAGLTQWVAGIFFPAVVATILVLLIGGGRWVLGRQLISGQSLLAPGGLVGGGSPAGSRPRPAPRAPSARRPRPAKDPEIDDWTDDSPFEGQQAFKTEMIPAVRPERPLKPNRPDWTGNPGGNSRPGRPPRDRDQGTDRDQWGDPRLPPDRGQQTGPRPRPRPNPQPGDRAPRPSFNPNQPNQRPQRPPQRRQPPEGWGQR